jgi:hypothetical protein
MSARVQVFRVTEGGKVRYEVRGNYCVLSTHSTKGRAIRARDRIRKQERDRDTRTEEVVE